MLAHETECIARNIIFSRRLSAVSADINEQQLNNFDPYLYYTRLHVLQVAREEDAISNQAN